MDSVVKPDEIVGLSFLVLVAGFILGLVLIGAETVAAFVGLSVQYNYKSLHLA